MMVFGRWRGVKPYAKRWRRVMQISEVLRAATLTSVLLLPLLVGACASSRVISAPPVACVRMVPEALWEPTPGVELPGNDAEALGVALNGQTGQLALANQDKRTIRHIWVTCEELFNGALKPKGFRQSLADYIAGN